MKRSKCRFLASIAVLILTLSNVQAQMQPPGGSSRSICSPEENSPSLRWPIEVKYRFGYINQRGEVIIPPKFPEAGLFREGLAAVGAGYQNKVPYLFIDVEGRTVIELPPKTSFLPTPFYEGLSAVCVKRKCGFVDRSGAFAIPPQFESMGYFSEGLAAVKIGKRVGYIDKTGAVMIQPQFEKALWFSGGLAGVKIGDKWGFIDRSGKLVISAQYESVRFFCEDVAVVQVGKKFGYIDKGGSAVIPAQFDEAYDFSRDQLAPVQVAGKWGYINKSGKLTIPTQFKTAYRFTEGLAGVEVDGKMGFIDPSGNMVIKPKFDAVWSFSNGVAFVSFGRIGGVLNVKGMKFGYINKEGKYIFEPVKMSGSGWGP